MAVAVPARIHCVVYGLDSCVHHFVALFLFNGTVPFSRVARSSARFRRFAFHVDRASRSVVLACSLRGCRQLRVDPGSSFSTGRT